MRLVIIGAGIAGLSAAIEAARGGIKEIVVVDSESRAGGKIHTLHRDGRIFEAGPDAFLRRNPVGLALVESLGLTGNLTAPSASSALLYANGQLHPMPRELAMGVPTDPIAPLKTTSVPILSRLRASVGISIGLKGDPSTDSLGYLCQRRLGRRFSELVVDPLIGGINAGSVFGSSMELVAPQLGSALTAPPIGPTKLLRRSVGTQKIRTAPTAPVFGSLSGGLSELVEAMVAELCALGVEFKFQTAALSMEKFGERIRLHLGSDDGVESELDSDMVVVAVPSGPASGLLAGLSKVASGRLGQIRYSSVALTVLGFRGVRNPLPAGISGVLSPARERTLTTAVSIASSKWPSWAEPDELLLRVSAGRMADQRFQNLDDEDLSDLISKEASRIVGLPSVSEPTFTKVIRWHDALPQFRPHHSALIASARSILANETGSKVAMAGSYMYGSGIPASIGSGIRAIGDLKLN